MLDIIGNVKVNEANPERVKYFFASLNSCFEFKDFAKIILNLDAPSLDLYNKVNNTLQNSGCDFYLQLTESPINYGKTYCDLITKHSKNYLVLNFIEDHFSTIDKDNFCSLLKFMKNNRVDVCKATFFEIEQNSSKGLKLIINGTYGKIFYNDKAAHQKYCNYYKSRYYIGVNFITTRQFAFKFWNRNINSTLPHPYEISSFDSYFRHLCMIPNIEIQASIDDDHGEPGTCLLKKKNKKFSDIWKKLRN